jgi:hypothetical protein
VAEISRESRQQHLDGDCDEEHSREPLDRDQAALSDPPRKHVPE